MAQSAILRSLILVAWLSGPVSAAGTGSTSDNYGLDRLLVNAAGSTASAAGKYAHFSCGEGIIGQTWGNAFSAQVGFLNEYFNSVPTATPTPVLTATPIVPDGFLRILNGQINPNLGEQATITWSQPRTAPLTLTIYNLAGEKVCTVVDGQTFAGGQIHQVRWDGRSSKGHAVGSGIYIVHLKIAGYEKHSKIAVLK